MVVTSLNSHRWNPGLTPQRCQCYFVLLPRNWSVQMMGEIIRLCIGDVSWLLQNGRDWGCGNGGAGVCEQTVEDGCDSLQCLCLDLLEVGNLYGSRMVYLWRPMIPQGCQISSILLWQNWTVETMDRGITRLCADDVSWLLKNKKNWGCGNSGAGVCWWTVEDE